MNASAIFFALSTFIATQSFATEVSGWQAQRLYESLSNLLQTKDKISVTNIQGTTSFGRRSRLTGERRIFWTVQMTNALTKENLEYRQTDENVKSKVVDLAYAISTARILERRKFPEDSFNLNSIDCDVVSSEEKATYSCRFESKESPK